MQPKGAVVSCEKTPCKKKMVNNSKLSGTPIFRLQVQTFSDVVLYLNADLELYSNADCSFKALVFHTAD